MNQREVDIPAFEDWSIPPVQAPGRGPALWEISSILYTIEPSVVGGAGTASCLSEAKIPVVLIAGNHSDAAPEGDRQRVPAVRAHRWRSRLLHPGNAPPGDRRPHIAAFRIRNRNRCERSMVENGTRPVTRWECCTPAFRIDALQHGEANELDLPSSLLNLEATTLLGHFHDRADNRERLALRLWSGYRPR